METVDALRLRVEERDEWLRKIGVTLLAAGLDGNLGISEGVKVLAVRLAASEARVRALEEAGWEISTMPCRRTGFVDNDPVAKFCPDLAIPRVIWCPSCIARAALAPPPGAAECHDCNGTGSVDAGAFVVGGEICAAAEPCRCQFPPPEAEKKGGE